eukprot:gnl/Ergobibamus_cyprinoides/485.p1 GENE.gnl/Ergobibamus_cyprinoides/485~~gnl/Ergobibamus_cyprinoides/485.p1  ORF type:complete len:238 (+),score=41.13 gnl/Ergobibamus_cyprinoides/485:186-899(+)
MAEAMCAETSTPAAAAAAAAASYGSPLCASSPHSARQAEALDALRTAFQAQVAISEARAATQQSALDHAFRRAEALQLELAALQTAKASHPVLIADLQAQLEHARALISELRVESKADQKRLAASDAALQALRSELASVSRDLEKVSGAAEALRAKLHPRSDLQREQQLEENVEALESELYCPLCNQARKRDTVLAGCGHVFCCECVAELEANRNRKCPSCATKFTSGDKLTIFLTG